MGYYFILARRLNRQGIVIGAFIEKETGKVVAIEGNIVHAAIPDKLKAANIEILQGKERNEYLASLGLWQNSSTGMITTRTVPVKKNKAPIEVPVMKFPEPVPGDPCPA